MQAGCNTGQPSGDFRVLVYQDCQGTVYNNTGTLSVRYQLEFLVKVSGVHRQTSWDKHLWLLLIDNSIDPIVSGS